MFRQAFFPNFIEEIATCKHCGENAWQDSLDTLKQCQQCHTRTHAVCNSCHQEFHNDDIFDMPETDTYHAEKLCQTCHDEQIFTCDDCGDVHRRDDECHHDDVCKSCSIHYFKCEDCDEWTHADHCHHESICESCGQDYYQCQGCQEWYHYESMNDDYCDSCNNDNDNFDNHSPRFRTFGKGRLFGIELELECENGTRTHCADSLIRQWSNRAEVKDDGSLSNGIEIASMPATYELQKSWWHDFFQNIPSEMFAYRTCGMHIHIDRDAISPLTLGKMIVFLNCAENRDFVTKIAGRKNIYKGKYDADKKIHHIKGERRYEAINTMNDDTIEVRIFASTTNEDEFMLRFEFVVALLDYCRDCSMNALTHSHFLQNSTKNFLAKFKDS